MSDKEMSPEPGAPGESPPSPPEEPRAEAQEFDPEPTTTPKGTTAPSENLLAEMQRERKEIYDRLLRTAADFDNFKKRSRRDSAEAEERGRLRLLKALLPVLDNLQRAVALDVSDVANIKGMAEGVKLVLRMFENVLEEFEVRSFDSVGQAFDPQVHEAISQLESDEVPVGTVLSEYQRGYRVGDKLLRPAMVVVAKPKTAATNGSESEEHGSNSAGEDASRPSDPPNPESEGTEGA